MKNNDNIKARQIRAARALANWSQEDLASAAALSITTIRKLELGHLSPRHKTLQTVRKAFEGRGLEFIEPGGVRYYPEDFVSYEGYEGLIAFLDDLYLTARKGGEEVVAVCASKNIFSLLQEPENSMFAERMKNLRAKLPMRGILFDDHLKNAPFSECKKMPRRYIDPVSFYIYGNKCGIITASTDPYPKIIVIQLVGLARGFRRQFQSMWERATPYQDNKK